MCLFVTKMNKIIILPLPSAKGMIVSYKGLTKSILCFFQVISFNANIFPLQPSSTHQIRWWRCCYFKEGKAIKSLGRDGNFLNPVVWQFHEYLFKIKIEEKIPIKVWTWAVWNAIRKLSSVSRCVWSVSFSPWTNVFVKIN